jgi:hypothetical protein
VWRGRLLASRTPETGTVVIHTTVSIEACYRRKMPASEVLRIAKRWLQAHGDDAVAPARDMVTELEESGNADGVVL